MSCKGLTGKALIACQLKAQKKSKYKSSPPEKGDMYYDNQYYDKSHMRKTKKPSMKDLPLGSSPRMEEYGKRGWKADATVSKKLKKSKGKSKK
jgi:hypothetical protein